MIIGITGSIGCGKEIVADYFRRRGFIHYTLSNIIREEIKKRNLEINRKLLQDIGNELRKNSGNNILARLTLEKIKEEDAVVDGIRNIAEIEEFKKTNNFKLIAVDAPKEMRYQRIVYRDRPGDDRTWEGFLKLDERDFNENIENGQQVGKCIEMADFKIINDSSFESLYKKLENIMEKI